MSHNIIGFYIAGAFGAIFILAMLIDSYRRSRITCPSDALVGMICGELRSGADGWKLSRQKFGGMQFDKGNITVVYSDFMHESCGVMINAKHIEISPSSGDALLAVVKPILKAHAKAKAQERKTRELLAVIKASQDMLKEDFAG